MGAGILQPYWLALLAEIFWWMGQADAGLETVAEARAMSTRNQEPWWEVPLYALKGESAVESGLFMRINQGLPSELHERLAVLRARREEETITDTEYEELTRLTDQAEELHAARMAALVELATLRGLPLSVLMDQLGIHLPEHV